jgi:hypothetical protein
MFAVGQRANLSNLKSLIGEESIVAECTGVNYTVYVTPSRVLVGKRFSLEESFVNVPHSSVSTLELITKSVIPPLTFAIIAAAGAFLVWWVPAQASPSPGYPYNAFILVGIGCSAIALVALWWRRRVAVLRIGVIGMNEPITVRMVRTSKADSVFRALKG